MLFVLLIFLGCMLLTPSMPPTPIAHSQSHWEIGKLRTIYPPESNKTPLNYDVNIVVVPEIGAPEVQSFDRSPWRWLPALREKHNLTIQVILLDYKVSTNGMSIWQSLAEHGISLPNILLSSKNSIGLFKRPLVFIGHGFGGVIVKKALTFVHGEQYNSQLRHILELHKATILLGCPRPIYTRMDLWGRLPQILRSCNKFSSQLLKQAEQEAAIVANISLKFEETGLESTLISAYETQKTKIPGPFFGQKKLLVDEDFAVLRMGSEKQISVAKDHLNINLVDINSQLFGAIVEILNSITKSGPESFPFSDEIPENKAAFNDFAWASSIGDEDFQKVVKQDSLEASKDNTKGGLQGTTESSFEMIPAVNDLILTRPTPLLPCYIMSPEKPIVEFTGRDGQLEAIHKSLALPMNSPIARSPEAASPRSFAISGTPGMGKSRIAIEYIYRYQREYDAIFWIQSDNNISLTESFLKVANQLGLLQSSEVKDAVIARNVVLEWLSNPLTQVPSENLENSAVIAPRARWLLVFDNADDLDELSDFWPSIGYGAILITSRNPKAKSYKTTKDGYDIVALPTEDAARLLRQLAGTEKTEQNVIDSMALVERLGNLPLAISQVAAVIRRMDMKYSEFLQVLEEDQSRNELIADEEGYSHTLSTIWRIEKLPPAAKALLDVFCLLDRGNIIDALFEEHLPSISTNTLPTSKLKYYEARDRLVQMSLIERNKDRGQILIHPLLQTVTRARMSSDEFRHAFSAAIVVLRLNWPQAAHLFSHETARWEKADLLVPHAIKIADEYRRIPQQKLSIDALRNLTKTLQDGGWHVAEKGNFVDAERMWNMSLEISKRYEKDMPEEYADALFCAGSHMSDTNQFKQHKVIAAQHFVQRMKIENSKSGLGLGAGMAYSEMALAHLLNDEYEEAIEFGRRSREINEKTPMFLENEYWPFFGIIHHAQGLIGLNRLEEAANLVQETIQWREKKYGLDDTESFKLGYALQVLGQIRYREGCFQESSALYQRALINYHQTLGFTHHRVGHVLVRLADHEALLHNHKAADLMYERAINIFKSHSCYDPELARTTFRRAQLYLSHNRNEDAERYLMEARLLYQKVIGEVIGPDKGLTLENFDSLVAIWAR